jgi:hypothetical protein
MEKFERIQFAALLLLLVTVVGIGISMVVINIDWFAISLAVGYICIGVIFYTNYKINKIKRGN